MNSDDYMVLLNYLAKKRYPAHILHDAKRGVRKKSERFIVKDGVLYSKSTSKFGDRVVALEEHKRRILKWAHESAEGIDQHVSKDRTSYHILETFYWKGVCTEVAQFVAECPKCRIWLSNNNGAADVEKLAPAEMEFNKEEDVINNNENQNIGDIPTLNEIREAIDKFPEPTVVPKKRKKVIGTINGESPNSAVASVLVPRAAAAGSLSLNPLVASLFQQPSIVLPPLNLSSTIEHRQRNAAKWASSYEMTAHLAGGLSAHTAHSSAIHLLTGDQTLQFHHSPCETTWHHYDGDPLQVYLITDEGGQLLCVSLGLDEEHGEMPVRSLPGGWCACEVTGGENGFCLFGCTWAGENATSDVLAVREVLLGKHFELREIIERFTTEN